MDEPSYVRRPARARAVLALCAALAACTGEVAAPLGPNQGDLAGASPTAFACDPGAGAEPSKLRRLSRTQYVNSVRDFVRAALPGDASAWDEIASATDAVPKDVVNKSAPFSTMDQAVSQQHVDTYVRIGQQVGSTLTATPARIAALAPCTTKAQSGCIDAMIERLGRRAYRHALSAEERTFLRSVYASDKIEAEAIRDLVTVLLNAPQFVYLVEFGAEPVAGRANTYTLRGHELASRLAYHFFQSAPDEELLAAAETGELDRADSYARVVDELLADPRAQKSLETFVAEWFDLESLRALDALAEDPVFAAFAGTDMPKPELRKDMIDDVLASFTHHVAVGDGLSEWLQSPYSFARTEGLAAIYETQTWSGSGTPPRFPAGERAGLLTRAALLSTGTANTRPIMKGVFIRQRLLCDAVPPPPPNVANVPPQLSPHQTTREVVEALTEAPKSNCASCHRTLINPLGFASENYDALGRLRKEQRLFDANGKEVARRPVDTASTPRVASSDARSARDVHDLLAYIVESGKAEQCFARQYVRFAYGRDEEPARDGCALESVRASLEDGDSLQHALRALALRPEFRQRRVD